MSIILRGPVRMSDVANLVQNITDSFYRWHIEEIKDVKNYSTSMVFWDESSITANNAERLPTYEGSHIRNNYNKLVKRKRLSEFKPVSSEFMAAINSRALCPGFLREWHNHLKTRIVNKTLLDDIISGQTIQPTVREFVINTWKLTNGKGWLTDFIQYRNRLVSQAQKRLDQSVSGAAWKMLKDLD